MLYGSLRTSLGGLVAALLALASVCASASDAQTEYAHSTDRVIVRLKGGAPAKSFDGPAREALAARLSAQGGEAMQTHRVMGDGAQVMRLNRRMPLQAIAALSKRFEHDVDVIEILPDRIFFPALTPTDPLFSQQWALSAANGINAPAAWDITTGSPNVIIGIIDTGKLPHVELAGRWIGGYDFVGDTNRSNDTDGRDADATDPGDWVTQLESNSGALQGCPVADSRWHGTAMAGAIGASANNGQGIVGVNWNSSLLPVRVAGKCGAYESDIADGIRWAVGIGIPNVPNNPNTADVLNVSLSSAGTCSAALQSAINEVYNAGVPLIVAAGNNTLDASGFSPGNCANVITVGAVDRNGGKPAYANFGSTVALSAPGGIAQIASGTPDQNWVLTTSNDGLTTASANNAYYTSVNGTSIATAIVTGISSLALSVNPSLPPGALSQILRNTSTPFPANTPALGSQADCTTSLCGKGIANAPLAVQSAAQWGNATPGVYGAARSVAVVRADGTVVAWGLNSRAQLGMTGPTDAPALPVPVPVLTGIVRVSEGSDANFRLAVRADGTVWGWGYNEFGQLGDGTQTWGTIPVQPVGLPFVTRVAAGAFGSIALAGDGNVWAWGVVNGQATPLPGIVPNLANVIDVATARDNLFVLKSDGTVRQLIPSDSTPVAGLAQITTIRGGSSHLVALASDATVWSYVLPTNSAPATTQQVSSLDSVIAVAAGADFGLALKTDGTVWAWGNNDAGQLGDGTTTSRSNAARIVGLHGVTSIGASSESGFAITSDGSVWTWGRTGNLDFLDGVFRTTNSVATHPVQVQGIGGAGYLDAGLADKTHFAPQFDVPVSSVRTSNAIVLAGIANGSAVSVTGGQYRIDSGSFTSADGTINNGQMVTLQQAASAQCGTTTSTTVTVAGIPRIFSVTTIECDTVPDAFSFGPLGSVAPSAMATSSTATIRGFLTTAPISISGGEYSVGCGAGSFTSAPGTIDPGATVCVRQVASGAYDTLTTATLTIGGVSAPFDVITMPAPSFVAVTQISGLTLEAGHALRSDGTLVGWGFGLTLGNGSTPDVVQSTPVTLPGPSGVVRLSTGGNGSHQLAIRTDGTLWAWGDNTYGQLGDGTQATRAFPERLTTLSSVTRVAVSERHTVALRSDGTAWTWGDNACGELGDGTLNGPRTTPASVSGLSGIIDVAAINGRSFALASDGTVWRWGGVAIAVTCIQPAPSLVTTAGLSQITAIAGGENHLLALKGDGTVWAWGYNTKGQLGNGTNTDALVAAIQVPGLTNVAAIAAGLTYSMALKSDGTLWTWGNNQHGELGDGTTTTRLSPVQVAGIGGVIHIATGGTASYAIKSDGTAWYWGGNSAIGRASSTIPARLAGVGGAGYLNLGVEDPAIFSPQTDVPVSTQVTSNTITLSGIGNGASIAASGGQYSPGCSGTFASSGTIDNGQTVCVRQTSAPACGTTTTTTLTIAGLPVKTFVVTTIACDTSPDPFSFVPQAGVTPGAAAVSNAVTITGINVPVSISVSGGQYSIGCTATFTSSAGTINSGQAVCVQQTSAMTADTLTTAVLTVGNSAAAFDVMTPVGPGFSVSPQMVGGQGFANALRSDGNVFSWGYAYGVGLDPVSPPRPVPERLPSLSGVVQLSPGSSFTGHALALRSDGTVWAWGTNERGQLGNGITNVASITPIRITALPPVTRVVRGSQRSFALTADGHVWSWGAAFTSNLYGLLLDGTTSDRAAPALVAGLSNVTDIAAGQFVTYVLKNDGTVWQAGGASTGDLTPTVVPGLQVPGSVTAISAGKAHGLGLTPNGSVSSFGSNSFGELGRPGNNGPSGLVSGLSGVVAVAAGSSHSVALKSDGTVWAWGYNQYGQLGDGSNVNRSTPVQVVGLSGVTAIGAGQAFTFAMKADGSVWAWGRVATGNLGNGEVEVDVERWEPLPVPVLGPKGEGFLGLLTANTVPAPFSFTASTGAPQSTQVLSNNITVSGVSAGVASPIVIAGGEYAINGGAFTPNAGTVLNGDTVVVRVMSSSSYSTTTSATLTIGGARGLSSTFFVRTKADPSTSRVVAIPAAGDSHTLLLATDGVPYAAGYNGNGQLGNGTTLGLSTMRPVAGLSSIVSVASGGFHGLALRNDGTVTAWGSNSAGQLGHNSTNGAELSYVNVAGLVGVSDISAGRYHSVAAKVDGTVWTWGLNVDGQLGDGTTVANRRAPVQVTSVTGVVAVAAGGRHTLALLASGAVMAWGANDSGQLGDGSTTSRNAPVAVSGLSNIVAIAAGDAHSLAIRSDGSVVAWGFNGFGQLGDGTTTNRSIPVAVASMGPGVGLITAGANHSLAVKAGGAMYAWGSNANNQLGNGSTTNSSVPVLLAAPTRVVAITGGARHTGAIDADRNLYIWGDNFFGQVGNRSGNYSPQSASLNVLRGDSKISEGTSSSGGGVGTGSNSGSSVLSIDGQATSFDFGSLSAGGFKTTSGKYRNESSSDDITDLALSVSGGSFSLQSTDCPSILPIQTECNFTISFSPSAASSFSGELAVNSSLVGSPERRSLFGTGVATAAIAFSKAGVDFPPQTAGTTSAASTLTLTNTGNATLVMSSPVASSLPDFAATHNCQSVAPGGTCTLSVTFTPNGPNSRTAQLTLSSNAAGSPQAVTLSGTGVSVPLNVPSAPQNVNAIAGNSLATFTFNPPAGDGGSPITSYTVTCNGGAASATGTGSPITIANLVNGTTYTCTIAAANANGMGAASSSVQVLPSGTTTFALTAVLSRKVHGSTTYNLPIDTAQNINGAITIEPRFQPTHQVVFVFNGPVSAAGSASAKDANNATVGSATPSASGYEVIVALNGLSASQRVTVSLASVNGSLGASAAIGFLAGDVNASKSVTAADILRLKGKNNQSANSANYLYDTDLSGAINAADVGLAKARSGLAIP